jgi:hypothetical protein
VVGRQEERNEVFILPHRKIEKTYVSMWFFFEAECISTVFLFPELVLFTYGF